MSFINNCKPIYYPKFTKTQLNKDDYNIIDTCVYTVAKRNEGNCLPLSIKMHSPLCLKPLRYLGGLCGLFLYCYDSNFKWVP